MRALLIGQQRLDKLLDTEPGNDEKEKERDLLCRAKLQLHVAGPLTAIVSRAKTAKAAWDALHQEYRGSLQVRQPLLMSSLTTLKQGSQSLVQYIDKAKALRDEFEALELKTVLPLLCQSFIIGLSDELRIACGPALHSTLRNKDKGLDDITDELRSLALLLPQSYATANTTRSMPHQRPQQHQRNHPKKHNPPTKRKETRTCHYCGKARHIKEDCRKFLRDKGGKKDHEESHAMCTRTEGMVSMLKNLDKDSFWYDTMATHHVVFQECLLSNRRPSGIKAVVLGGNERHPVSCQGDLRVEGGPNGPIIFSGVICAPTLLINLCSGPQFTNKGGESWQGGNACKLMKNGITLLEGRKEGNMYKLSCKLPGASASESFAHATAALWHRRLGHPGLQVVPQLIKTDAVRGLDKVILPTEQDKCEVWDHRCEADKRIVPAFRQHHIQAAGANPQRCYVHTMWSS
jgi:hypothetical protein